MKTASALRIDERFVYSHTGRAYARIPPRVSEMQLQVERVHCCVCRGTGRVQRFLFFTGECHVCEGSGERPIIMNAHFSEETKELLRADAIAGTNRFYTPPDDFNQILGSRLF